MGTNLTKEEKAFLDTIAWFEGTLGASANGYDIRVIGIADKAGETKTTKSSMNGWTENTDIRHGYVSGDNNYQDKTWYVKVGDDYSTAAGRYQFIGTTWASNTKKELGVYNAPMTKDNQNIIAMAIVKKKIKNSLTKALTDYNEFTKILTTLKSTWTSFKKTSRHQDGWALYKGAYEKYKNGIKEAAVSNTNQGGLLYLNQEGQKIDKFGTQKISSNGDTSKFYVNIPSGTVNKIIYFWSGLESVISRESQWNQIPQNIKNSCYIVMAAGTTSGNQNSLSDLKNVIKKYNSAIKTNQLKEYIMGYSAGGYSVFNNYSKNFEFVGLIDPSLSSEANTENRKYDKNVALIWGSSGMIGISNWASRYPKLNTKIKDDGGFSQKIDKLDHGKAIEVWFEKYGSKITSEQSSQSNTKVSLPITIKGSYSANGLGGDALHSFDRRKSDGFGGYMFRSESVPSKWASRTKVGTQGGTYAGKGVNAVLADLISKGVKPKVSKITINIDWSKYAVSWEVTIDKSSSGNSFVGVATRGSIGNISSGTYSSRADGQIPTLKNDNSEFTNWTAPTIVYNGKTMTTGYLEDSTRKLRQYFLAYTKA